MPLGFGKVGWVGETKKSLTESRSLLFFLGLIAKLLEFWLGETRGFPDRSHPLVTAIFGLKSTLPPIISPQDGVEPARCSISSKS